MTAEEGLLIGYARVSVSTLHRAFGGRGIPLFPPEVRAKKGKKK